MMEEPKFREWDKDWAAAHYKMYNGLKEVEKTRDELCAVLGNQSPVVEHLSWALTELTQGKVSAEGAIYEYFIKDVDMVAKLKPRRIYDDDFPKGYVESDKDYVLNNLELCVEILNSLAEQLEDDDAKETL